MWWRNEGRLIQELAEWKSTGSKAVHGGICPLFFSPSYTGNHLPFCSLEKWKAAGLWHSQCKERTGWRSRVTTGRLNESLPCSLNATASFLWPTYHPPRAGSWRVPLRINQRALNKSTDIWEFPEERRAYYMNILQWGIPVASYIELAIWFFSPSLLKHDLAKDHQKLGGKLRTWRPDQNKKKKRNLEENWGIT